MKGAAGLIDKPAARVETVARTITLAKFATANLCALNHYLHGTVNADGVPAGDYVPAPFHHKLGAIVEAIDRGDITRAVVSCPPQHGKSTHTTQSAPLFHIGRAEARGRPIRVGIATYAVSLAKDMATVMRDAVENGRLESVFPGLAIRRDRRSATNWQTEGGSSLRAVGVGGGFTGKPFDFIYVDDPYKNMEEALSESYRAKVDRWYKTVVRPRLSGRGRLVVIQTRWHSKDLAGSLIAGSQDGTGDAFEVFSLPAIEGEGTPEERPLWPERYPLEYLHKTREISGVRFWSTVYQQIPVDKAPGEALPDPQRWAGPVPDRTKIFGYVDPAYDGKDRTAYIFGGALPDGRIVITAAESKRANAVGLAAEIAATAMTNGGALVYVEDNADRGYTASAIRGAGALVRTITNTKNKLGRIHAHARAQWGRIYFADTVSPEYLRRLSEWTELAPHDDEPDALAGLVERLTRSATVAYTDM